MTSHTALRRRPSRAVSVGLASALALGALGFIAPTAAQAAPVSGVKSGSISWGLKESFRSYIAGAAGGTITATAPATDNGAQTTFPNAAGSWKSAAASVQAEGSVNYTGHEGVLDLTISDPSIVVNEDGAFLVVDAVDSYDGVHNDLKLAELDLTGAVSEDGYTLTITGAPATLTEEGTDLFVYNGNSIYPAGTDLAPVNATFSLVEPTVTVSRTSFYDNETATITVTGSGFKPSDTLGSRPPLNGQPAGVYIAAGKFAENWKPSAGVASSARKTLSAAQGGLKWAVLAANIAGIGGANAGAIELLPDGTFTAEITLSKALLDAAAGDNATLVNYGIYTYPGSGGTNAAWETYTPIAFKFTMAPPTISGDLNVGSVLTAEVPTTLPDGATSKYQWFANGSRISGATNATLTLAKAQLGKTVSVGVTVIAGADYASEVSEPTAKVAGILIPVTGQPTVTGTAQVGKKLTANGTAVTTTVAKTSRSYQWYADGVAIKKATKSTLTLGAAQIGKKITVEVVLKRSGHETTSSQASAETAEVAPATFTNTKPAKISGTQKVGKTIKASGAKWSTSGVKVTYKWYATIDGVTSLIQHSTSSKLKLTAADRGATISVELVASKAGYTGVTNPPVSTTSAVK